MDRVSRVAGRAAGSAGGGAAGGASAAGRRRWSQALVLSGALALLLGCSRGASADGAGAGGRAPSGAKAQGAGGAAGAAGGSGVQVVQVAPGLKKALRASADGAWLAWLDRCAEVGGPFLPPGTSSCELSLAPSGGGAATVVARGVTSLPHGFGFAPEGGALAALAGYDHAAGAGALVLAHGAEVREVARGATFHGFLPGTAGLLVVAGGALSLVPADGVARAVAGATGVASFDAAPAPWGRREVAVLVRRPAAAGGGLLALGADLGAARPVAERSREFGLGRGGAWGYTTVESSGAVLHLGRGGRAAPVARGARSFEFSSDGAAVAWVSEAAPGVQGDLHLAAAGGAAVSTVGGVSDGAPAGAGGPALAVQVGEHRWASAAPRLAWLERYDPRSRSGVLGSGGPGQPTRTFGAGVTDFELSPDGAHLAFLRHTTERGYSVDLELVETGAPTSPPYLGVASGADATPTSTPTSAAPPNSTAQPQRPFRGRVVARGVFGFTFSPDGRWLYYRTRCTRQAEACDLERVPTSGPGGGKPEELAQGMKSFEFDPRDPARLLITWQRPDLVALDVAVWQGGRLVAVDRGALPGSIRFLGPDSRRVAYAVVEPKRAGVYVATLPAE